MKFTRTITVQDPDTGNDVELEVWKHDNGGMFAIDSSYLEQGGGMISDPFEGGEIELDNP